MVPRCFPFTLIFPLCHIRDNVLKFSHLPKSIFLIRFLNVIQFKLCLNSSFIHSKNKIK